MAASATIYTSKRPQVPDHVAGERSAQCVCCDYKTQCHQVAVCKPCFSKRLKQTRPERVYSVCDIWQRPYRHVSASGWVTRYRETEYRRDFGDPAKYPMIICDCFMCEHKVWSEYTVPICQSCIGSFQLDISAETSEPIYMCSSLTTRFPANTLAPATNSVSGAMLDVIPHIAACLLAATAGDIGMAIATLLNLMEAVQYLVSPHVIVGHIRTQSPNLYRAWHDFLLAMKYCERYSGQTIPASFGHVCSLKHDYYGVPDLHDDVSYKTECECELHSRFHVGSEYYPPSRTSYGSLQVVSCDSSPREIIDLIETLITTHYQRCITKAVQSVIYMNNANADEYSSIAYHGKTGLGTRHPRDTRPTKKQDRRTRHRPARSAGKSKRLAYQLGNYSLV